MKLYPAIDLKDGVCVRLLRGEMTTATSFNDDPADQALRFAAMGFEALHVVDLNGAFEGHSVNHNAVVLHSRRDARAGAARRRHSRHGRRSSAGSMPALRA